MSSAGTISGPSWYKIFVVSIAVFDSFLLIILSRCIFTFQDSLSAFNTVLCVSYAGFAVMSLVFGLFVSFIGIENAKRTHKNPGFFYFFILYFLAITAAFIMYKYL